MAVLACAKCRSTLLALLVDCLLFEAEGCDDQDEDGELQGEEGSNGGWLGLGLGGGLGGDASHRVSSGCGRGVAQKRPQKPSECTL